ncbi:hypothetical protein Tco_1093729 [Tanacetum coccineum]|uniref:Uncharacterized protein n=1 Tax=Tanacetum coccineum TaxID=301880 RepID=A0ABQ5IDJ9_9ASTR
MASFRLLHSLLQVLSNNDLKRPGSEGGFERAFASIFDQDVQTFRVSLLLNLDQLQKQLDKDEFQEDRSMAAFGIKVKQFRETLLQHMGNVKKSVVKRTHHKRQYDRRANKRQMQTHASKVDSSKVLDANLVVMERNGTESRKQDSSGNYLTHVVDADIRPVNDQVPFAEINELKAQLQAKNSTINNLKKQIKNVHKKKNEKLNKENEHLKQTYKELYDSVKKTRILMKDHNDSLIAQVNSKTIENVDLKAQIQEKVQSPESRNNIKPAKRIPNVNKPERWISKGYRFSPNKSSAVHEKPNTPRSCLRWKPTGRIFKIASLRWIPTVKMFINSTTKVESEPPNGSNDDITNPYECDQTLNVSASTPNLSAGTSFNPIKESLRTTLQASLLKEKIGVRFSALYLRKKRNLLVYDHSYQQLVDQRLVQNLVSSSPYVPPSKKDYDIILSSTIIVQDVPSVSTYPTTQVIQFLVIHQGVKEQIQGIQNDQFDNEPLLHNLTPDPSSEESSSRGDIPLNLHQLNQSFDNLSKWSKDHPLE